MYWYLNKRSNTALIFSSLTAIHNETGINLDTLKYHFSRHKRTSYEDTYHRIEKTAVIKSKRKL